MRLLLLMLVLLLWPAWAQEPSPSPTPVPLAEIAAQLEQAEAQRQSLQEKPGPQADLTDLRREVATLVRETQLLVAGDPSVTDVRALEDRWTSVRTPLKAKQTELSVAASVLDADAKSLEAMTWTWQATLVSARESDAPAELVSRLEAFPGQLQETQQALRTRRSELLAVQTQLSGLDAQADKSIQSLSQVRTQAVSRLFSQDAPPLWRPAAWYQAGGASMTAAAIGAQFQLTSEYLATNAGSVLLHLVLSVMCLLVLQRIQRRAHGWVDREPALERPLAIFQAPLTMTLMLGVIFAEDIYTDAPNLLYAGLAALALLPARALLARLLDPSLKPLLTFLMLNFFVDQLRAVLEAAPLAGRLVLLAQMLVGLIFLLRRGTAWRLIAWAGLLAFGLAAVANVAGFLSLANLVAGAALDSGYLAIGMAAMLNILDALFTLALLVPPLGLLNAVQNHRLLIRHRFRTFLKGLMAFLWTLVLLDSLTLTQATVSAMHGFLDDGLTIGELRITWGEVLAFAAVMLLTLWASRLGRFLLEEDIYPRVDLPRGLPYTLSTMLHYAVLALGLLFALSALGIDTGRFAVVIGALSVGIGLGLQSIVHNFVSGLILLLERPVKVGDQVKVGSQSGELTRIGLRASVVRTWEGAEVILPNGSLISQEVVNWSTIPTRRLDIKLGVAHGSDVEEVLRLLVQAASELPEVTDPDALFLDFGETALQVQLRATTRATGWSRVRSQLLLRVNAVLREAGVETR